MAREYIPREDFLSPKLVVIEGKRANNIMSSTIELKDDQYEMGLKGADKFSFILRSLMHLPKNPITFTADVREMFH